MQRAALLTGTFALAALAWPGSGLRAGQQPSATVGQQAPSFRTEVNYIEIDASVTDGQGQFVRGLTRDDFEVLEDNTPRPVQTFGMVDLPLDIPGPSASAAATVPPPSDVADNRTAAQARVYLIVVDGFHISPRNTPRMARILRQFIVEDLGPNDLAAVVTVGPSGAKGVEFTSDKTRMFSALGVGNAPASPVAQASDVALPKGPRDGAEADAIAADLQAMAQDVAQLSQVDAFERSLQALGAATRYFVGLRGRRKTLLLFSEGTGIDTNLLSTADPVPEEIAARARAAIQHAVQAVIEANVTVDTVDPAGLAGVDLLSARETANPVSGASANAGEAVDPASTAAKLGQLTLSGRSLRELSDRTGGIAVVGYNNFAEPFRRIVQDNSSYYVLGYNAGALPHNGDYHRLTVRVKRPGVQVRARPGYYAPDRKPDADVAAIEKTWEAGDVSSLLGRQLPTGDLGLALRVTASPVTPDGHDVTMQLAVEVDGHAFAFVDHGGSFDDDVEVGYEAIDRDGRAQGARRDTVKLRLKPAVRALVAERGWRYVSAFTLAPGSHQLRVAVRESGAGHAGSAYLDVDVPDFAKAGLVMGSPAITARSAGMVPTAGTVPALKGILPGPVTAARAFLSADTLAAFARVVDNDAKATRAVTITTTVRDAQGQAVVTLGGEHPPAELRADARGYLVVVPLAKLPLGAYTLEIRATRGEGRALVERVPFRVAREGDGSRPVPAIVR